MAAKFVSLRNLKFMLYEVFDVVSLTKHPYFEHHSLKGFEMVLDAAQKLARNLLRSSFEEMDRNPPELVDGEVKVHPSVRKVMKQFGEGGWIAAKFPLDLDGEQMPALIADACGLIYSAANYSASVYPTLTMNAARLITSFGSQEQIKTFVSEMLEGNWQGTMALTEPQAGSSLADITTCAEPSHNGYYHISGQKIFISAGDHDGVENIVHLMLAKIKGSPAGVKGISLFIVPKKRFDEHGKLVSNDVTVSQIFHKLGYRGAPITELVMGENKDCRGYLVGEANRGLGYMFQMMNSSRIEVGIGAAGIASAAYYAALDYTRERQQGRKLTTKDPSQPQIPIIQHPDVKRMLLFQRAVVEGSLAILMQCCQYLDLAKISNQDEKETYLLLVDILIPVAKTYPSEMSILSTSQSLQCLGGYGYCDDFPVEQHFRDTRIHPIHEGTTGIQGLDILGRKIRMKNGKAFQLFLQEVGKIIIEAKKNNALQLYANKMEESLAELQNVTSHLLQTSQVEGLEVFLSDATLYLEYFSLITVGWQWLLQATTVEKALQTELSTAEMNFYQGKKHTAHYFFHYELPKTKGLRERLMDGYALTVAMQEDFFND